ncbi:UPF0149 family protein [Teredinibacter haidensis]|uniref:UPF0149 family protein n=1 Tax=Teredinibacter haidensis TaxID=2731755 RepID=UPI000948CD80|nr:UPF0149 family protein [Teredinibacter haidensis]
MNYAPLTEDELNFVESIIFRCENDNSIIDMSELDGFFTAIVSSPNTVMPSVWYPEIWGGQGAEPEWQKPEEMEKFMRFTTQHMNNNIFMLLERSSEFEALFNETEANAKTYNIVDEWCFGYMRGVTLSGWEKLPKNLRHHLDRIALHGTYAGYEQLDKMSETEFRQSQQKIEPAARALHSYWFEQRSDESTDTGTVLRTAPKTGRNDPCPCGSGKKYKKCCLH